jgi:hypothetical protein
MADLGALTAEQLIRAEHRLLNPAPGSRIAAARDYGVDLSLMLEQLRLSPSERAAQMLEVCKCAGQLRGLAHRR